MSTVGLFHSTSSGNISNPSMLMFKRNLCSRNNYKVSVWVQTDVICGCKKDFLTDSLSYKLGGWSLKDIGISRTESVCCRLYQAALLDLIILESDPSCWLKLRISQPLQLQSQLLLSLFFKSEVQNFLQVQTKWLILLVLFSAHLQWLCVETII